MLDVGNRVDRSFYDTRLSFTYELCPKTSIEVTGNQLIAVTRPDAAGSFVIEDLPPGMYSLHVVNSSVGVSSCRLSSNIAKTSSQSASCGAPAKLKGRPGTSEARCGC